MKLKDIKVSHTLIICSLLVSIPVFLAPGLRTVFTASRPHQYPWWFITALFVHDNQVIPLYLHIIGNISVVAFFGIRVEKILGSRKVLILVVVAFLSQLGISAIIDAYGDGLSGIAWAFAPLLIPQTLASLRYHKGMFWKDRFLLVALPLYFVIWVAITLASFQMGMVNTNTWHAVATLVGLVFLFIWRKDVQMDQVVDTKADRRSRRVALILPALLSVLLMAALTNVIPYASPARITSIEPLSGSIQQINDLGGMIKISFSHPMAPSLSMHSSIHSEWGGLKSSSAWIDDSTFVVTFTRPIRAGERISLTISKLKDQTNLVFPHHISLDYQ